MTRVLVIFLVVLAGSYTAAIWQLNADTSAMRVRLARLEASQADTARVLGLADQALVMAGNTMAAQRRLIERMGGGE